MTESKWGGVGVVERSGGIPDSRFDRVESKEHRAESRSLGGGSGSRPCPSGRGQGARKSEECRIQARARGMSRMARFAASAGQGVACRMRTVMEPPVRFTVTRNGGVESTSSVSSCRTLSMVTVGEM